MTTQSAKSLNESLAEAVKAADRIEDAEKKRLVLRYLRLTAEAAAA